MRAIDSDWRMPAMICGAALAARGTAPVAQSRCRYDGGLALHRIGRPDALDGVEQDRPHRTGDDHDDLRRIADAERDGEQGHEQGRRHGPEELEHRLEQLPEPAKDPTSTPMATPIRMARANPMSNRPTLGTMSTKNDGPTQVFTNASAMRHGAGK